MPHRRRTAPDDPIEVRSSRANRYESDVTVRKGSEAVNGKSIMGLMTLAANQGSVLELEVSGPDAEKAMTELEQFLSSDNEDPAKGSGK